MRDGLCPCGPLMQHCADTEVVASISSDHASMNVAEFDPELEPGMYEMVEQLIRSTPMVL